jgi:hypothetical protein
MWNATFLYWDLVLLIVIFGAGIHLLALFWRVLENKPSVCRPTVLAGIVISIIVFVPVFAGELIPMQVRIIMVVLYSIVAAWLALQSDEKNWVLTAIVIFVPVWFSLWGMVRLEIFPHHFNLYLFNVPVLLTMIAMIFLSSRNSAVRTYVILSLSGCLFEFLK